MKLDFVKTIIAVVAGALLAYGTYSWCINDKGWLVAIFSFMEFSILLCSALALKVDWLRSMANVKVLSWLFFIAVLIMNVLFACNGFNTSSFVISNGCVLLVFLVTAYSIINANKD